MGSASRSGARACSHRPVELQPDVELLDGAMLDLDVVEAARVVDSVGRRTVDAVDRMPAEVEPDVARPDHETIAGAVQEIVFHMRVMRDHLAAGDVLGERRARTDRKQDSGRSCENAKPNQQPQPIARTSHLLSSLESFGCVRDSDAHALEAPVDGGSNTSSARIQTQMTRDSAKARDRTYVRL